MPVITTDDIQSLAQVRSTTSPIVSCYLDVDGSHHVRPADYERSLENLFKPTRNAADPDPAVLSDLDRIEARIAAGFDRSRVRGVAVFACQALDLFVVHELAVPVRNQLTVNHTAAVSQLEVVLQQTEKIAVLAADKQHARVFVFRLGELVERTERTDDIGRDYDTVGEHDRGGVDHHRAEMTHQHLRNAADLLWSVFQGEGFDHLALIAPGPIASELEADLHPYLRDRLHGRLDLSPQASEVEIRDAVLVAEREIAARRDAALVADLRDAAASNGRGATGIDRVLAALAERRVDRLVVSDGYELEGWMCESCGRLATIGRTCTCGEEMIEITDLVEEAVEEALAQSCRVDVCTGNADLDVLGRIGAFLRY